MKKKAVIIDYGIGNINSLANLLEDTGYNTYYTNKKNLISNCDLLVLPGVGKYNKAIENLKSSKIFSHVKKKIIYDKIPTVGICLGMQLLFKSSEEDSSYEGLNIFNQKIVDLKKFNIGWSSINFRIKNINNLYKNNSYYFNHRYGLKGNYSFSKAFKSKSRFINSIIIHENIMGFQFHPEKSHKNGMVLFKNLIKNIL